MLGRKKQDKSGGTATIDQKNAAIATSIGEVIGTFRTLKNDARSDLCNKGQAAFERVIDSMVRLRNVVQGDASPATVEPAPTQGQLARGREKVAGWVSELNTELQRVLRETPATQLSEKVGTAVRAHRTKVQGLRLEDLG